MTKIEADGRPRGGPARDETAPACKRTHASVPRRFADVLDDNVGAAAAGRGADLACEVGRVMIEYGLGTETHGPFRLVCCCRREHAGAGEPGELDRRLTHAAAAGENEHDVARGHASKPQHVCGGQKRQRKRGRVDVVHMFWQRHEVVDGDRQELRVAAVAEQAEHIVGAAELVTAPAARDAAPATDPGLQHDARAHRNGPAAGFHDVAGHVAPGDVGQRNRDARNAPSLPEIQMIERAGTDAHDRVAAARTRLRRVFVLQDLGRSMVVEANRFHVRRPRSPRSVRGPAYRVPASLFRDRPRRR